MINSGFMNILVSHINLFGVSLNFKINMSDICNKHLNDMFIDYFIIKYKKNKLFKKNIFFKRY